MDPEDVNVFVPACVYDQRQMFFRECMWPSAEQRPTWGSITATSLFKDCGGH